MLFCHWIKNCFCRPGVSSSILSSVIIRVWVVLTFGQIEWKSLSESSKKVFVSLATLATRPTVEKQVLKLFFFSITLCKMFSGGFKFPFPVSGIKFVAGIF